MRLVDKFGEDVTNLMDLEPYIHFVEDHNGRKSPITRIVYGLNRIEIEWSDSFAD